MPTGFSGIVLAGGESRRLGEDKALLDFGGRTLLEITVERLRAITADVVIACGAGPRAGWPEVEARTALDRTPGWGPLAGLEAGLKAIANEVAVAVACDMPFLNAELLRHMASLLDGHDAVVPVVGDRQHALHAVYSRGCLPVVEELLERRGSMRELLAAVRTRVVSEAEVRAVDPTGLSCFNLNSQQDLEAAREMWAGARRPA